VGGREKNLPLFYFFIFDDKNGIKRKSMIDIRKTANLLFYALFFLLPLFYVPKIGTSYVLNQKLLLIVLVCGIFGLFCSNFIKEKKVRFKRSTIIFLLGGFGTLAAISFLFAQNILQGFLGRPNTLDSFVMLAVYCVLAFLVCNFLPKKEALANTFRAFILGSSVLVVIFLGSLILKFKNDFFVPIESFALIFALAFSCLIALIFSGLEKDLSKTKKIISGIIFALLLGALLIIGYKLAWFMIFIVSFLIFWRQAAANNFDWKKTAIILPLVIACISFVLFFFPKVINYDFQFNYEQSLSYNTGYNIALKTLKESDKNILFGAGPTSFIYKYSLYKGTDLGDTNLVFNQGPITFLTLAGSLGLGVLLLFMAWIIFAMQGFKDLQTEGEREDRADKIKDIIFPIGFVLFALMFLYKMTLIPLVFSFFILGAWANANIDYEIEIQLNKTKSFGFKVVLGLIGLVLVGGAIVFGLQYYAESNYQRGVREYNQKNIDNAIKNGSRAVNTFNPFNILNVSDYYIGVSQLYILKANDIFNTKNKNKNEVRDLASQAEALAKLATEHDSQNYNVWYNLGLIYENTSFLVDNKNSDAEAAYAQALKLAPYNFDIYFSLGKIYEKEGENAKAAANYEQAFSLNPNLTELPQKLESLKNLLN
jgi:tetratricopeptide (TPR) repeat protein